MNKALWTILAATFLTAGAANAQQKKDEKKVKEEKEVIIKNGKQDKHEKMVIVIDDDNVTINGKPADEYKGKKQIIISDDNIMINGDVMHRPGSARAYVRGFGKTTKPVLGVVTGEDAKGVKVNSVKEESSAAKAGLKEGDIITGVNGVAVKSPEELVTAIGKMKPDDEVDVAYLRDGKTKKVKAKLGKMDTPFAISMNNDPGNFNFDFDMRPPVASISPKGMHGFTWNDQDMWDFRNDRPKYGMSIEDNADGDGVKVTALEAESNALKSGLKENDIITAVDGKNVKGVGELKESLAEARDKSSVSLNVLRSGSNQTLTLKVPKLIRKADL